VFGAARFTDVPLCSPRRLYIGMDTTHPSATPDTHSRSLPTRPLLVSVVEAAAMLSLSRSSIYQLIWSDQLTPIRIGRSVRFSVEHLEAFVADRLAER
jgi:excisionase family DNA binding protein